MRARIPFPWKSSKNGLFASKRRGRPEQEPTAIHQPINRTLPASALKPAPAAIPTPLPSSIEAPSVPMIEAASIPPHKSWPSAKHPSAIQPNIPIPWAGRNVSLRIRRFHRHAIPAAVAITAYHRPFVTASIAPVKSPALKMSRPAFPAAKFPRLRIRRRTRSQQSCNQSRSEQKVRQSHRNLPSVPACRLRTAGR